jgi:hypothetical protein
MRGGKSLVMKSDLGALVEAPLPFGMSGEAP